MTTPPLAELKNLSVGFPDQDGGWRPGLEKMDLSIARGERVGLIGASGSGKSLTALAILGLAPPPGRIIEGEVLVDGRNTLTMTMKAQRRIRGRRIGLVLQEAETALNPVMTIGAHLKEVLRTNRPEPRGQWRRHAGDLLEEVGLDPARTLPSHAHQLSGGQRQRVMLALALACGPELVIADEPTSALDLLTQARILLLLDDTCSRRGISLLLISHDLDVVTAAVDRVVVLLDGRIVEESTTRQMLEGPLHPFTRAMVQSIQISANPPETQHVALNPRITGCRYANACPLSVPDCLDTESCLLDGGNGRRVRCPVVLERAS